MILHVCRDWSEFIGISEVGFDLIHMAEGKRLGFWGVGRVKDEDRSTWAPTTPSRFCFFSA